MICFITSKDKDANHPHKRASFTRSRARGCPFIANVDGEDFVIDGFTKYKGYGDECKTIYFAGVALFQDEENKKMGT